MQILAEFSDLVKKSLEQYVAALIHTKSKKTCKSMAETLGISHDALYRFLTDYSSLQGQMLLVALHIALYFNSLKGGYLILDDTAVSKKHSEKIEGVSTIFNSAAPGTHDKGFAIVALLWSNGDITIPIDFSIWYNKEVMGEALYRKKSELAEELLKRCKGRISFDFVLFDGLFETDAMRVFCDRENIPFVSKIRKNRVITIEDETAQLKNHSQFKLVKNLRQKTLEIKDKGLILFVTVYKRKGRGGDYDTCYLVSNRKYTPHEYIKLYQKRWVIETFFRSIKQDLGLGDCQARTSAKQNLHITTVFNTYAFLEYQKVLQNRKNVQEVRKALLVEKPNYAMDLIARFHTTFGLYA